MCTVGGSRLVRRYAVPRPTQGSARQTGWAVALCSEVCVRREATSYDVPPWPVVPKGTEGLAARGAGEAAKLRGDQLSESAT